MRTTIQCTNRFLALLSCCCTLAPRFLPRFAFSPREPLQHTVQRPPRLRERVDRFCFRTSPFADFPARWSLLLCSSRHDIASQEAEEGRGAPTSCSRRGAAASAHFRGPGAAACSASNNSSTRLAHRLRLSVLLSIPGPRGRAANRACRLMGQTGSKRHYQAVVALVQRQCEQGLPHSAGFGVTRAVRGREVVRCRGPR
jgi:hypothetical protein